MSGSQEDHRSIGEQYCQTVLMQNGDSGSFDSPPRAIMVPDLSNCLPYLSLKSANQNSSDHDFNIDLGQPTTSECRVLRKSSLVYTLAETLRDSVALGYFIQFMEEIVIKNDADSIFAKYIGQNAPYSIGITEEIRKKVTDRVYSRDGSIDSQCFDDAQKFVFDIMEKRYFTEFLSSVYYTKHRLEVLSTGEINISDILKCQRLLSSFYMESEGERKLIEFIIAADSFTQQLQFIDGDQAIGDAMIIYNKYFSMQATEPLKFGAKIRIQMESDICSESGRPSLNSFDTARRLAISILEQNYLKRFICSPSFIKYLHELMEQVNSSLEMPNSNRMRRTLQSSISSQSSDVPLSPYFEKSDRAQGTGLSALSVPSVFATDDDETASQSDSVKSYGPGGMRYCKRRKTGLPLAVVDYLGRYRVMYDKSYCTASEEYSSRHKLKSTWERYFHHSNKKDSELADQVAQLIIADIQNMVSLGSLSNVSQSQSHDL
ncbi:unnamed protein product [Dracunculus medinensis]|uniref:RGS domain-containing protein n=1 Tax=Dracunculus medinensis TaxID=318479 RepID=A0A0N4UQC9_DRAME|nr:unnamed protein product [Dracunculus medinensis]